MKWITTIVLATLLGGCSLVRELPPVQSYYLEGNESIAASGASCGGRVIRVALVDAPQWLGGTVIYYTGADQKMYRYTRARWEEPPTAQLQQIIENSLVASGLFNAVVPYQSLAKNNWLLEVRVEKMSQHISTSGSGETELKLYAVLVDRYSRRVLAQQVFNYRNEGSKGDVQGAIDGWNRSMGLFAGDLVAWLAQECAAAPEHDSNNADL